MREAAMTGLGKVVIAIARWQEGFLSPEILSRIIGGIAQQAVERIDRTRFLAGKVFSDLLHNEYDVSYSQFLLFVIFFFSGILY